MADQLPVLQVLAGMERDTRKGIEARGNTEESFVPFRDVDTARVWVEAGKDRIVDSGIGFECTMPARTKHACGQGEQENDEQHVE